ncbi:hypothetical protein EMIT036CA2_10458 [Chryseobacterium sp. IT-36CA2]
MKKTLNTLSASQQRSALNGKTEPTEEYTSKLNNKLIDILYKSHAMRGFFCHNSFLIFTT